MVAAHQGDKRPLIAGAQRREQLRVGSGVHCGQPRASSSRSARRAGLPPAGRGELGQEAAMPSPPAAPATVTLPRLVSAPPVPTLNASTMPFAPVCTYRNAPLGAAAASTVPGSVAVWPSSVSWPLALEAYPLTLALPALEAYSVPPARATQQVAACPVPTESISVTVPSEPRVNVAREFVPAFAITR